MLKVNRFLQAASSQAWLNISLAHAQKIFTYFQVTPSYLDFVSVFTARRTDEVEISDTRFSSFRERVRLASRGLDLPHLNVSGSGYQISYNLKCVANVCKEDKVGWALNAYALEDWDWSTRQAVFHHQFDTAKGTTLWILTAPRDYLQQRVQNLVGQSGTSRVPAVNNEEQREGRTEDRTFTTVEESFIASLSVHLLLAQYASEDWRGYLRWLEQKLERMVSLPHLLNNVVRF